MHSLLDIYLDDTIHKYSTPLKFSREAFSNPPDKEIKCAAASLFLNVGNKQKNHQTFSSFLSKIPRSISCSSFWVEIAGMANFKISLLVLSILRQNTQYIEELLTREPGLIFEKNRRNYSPLHFAAMLESGVVYDFLLKLAVFQSQKNELESQKTDEGLTPIRIRQLCQNREDGWCIRPFLDDTEVNQENFKFHFPGRNYFPGSRFEVLTFMSCIQENLFSQINTQMAFESDGRRSIIGSENFHQHLRQQYISSSLETDRVYLSSIKNSMNSLTPFELRARSNIPAGHYLFECGGVIKSEKWIWFEQNLFRRDKRISSLYVDQTEPSLLIDSSEEGGVFYQSMTQGFPNIAIKNILDNEGIPRLIVYSLSDIKEGDLLKCNFGRSFVNQSRMLLDIDQQAISEYLEETKNLTDFGGLSHFDGLIKHMKRPTFSFEEERSSFSLNIDHREEEMEEADLISQGIRVDRHCTILNYLKDFSDLMEEGPRNLLKKMLKYPAIYIILRRV